MADSRMDLIRARKKPRTAQVAVVVDQDQAQDIETTRSQLAKVAGQVELLESDPGSAIDARLAALIERRDELKAKMDAWVNDNAIVVFSFRACGRATFAGLKRDNPPIEAGQDVGPEFAPLLVAECSVDPKITGDDALEMWDDDPAWSDADLELLFLAALSCNRTPSTVSVGKGWGGTPNSA